MDREERPETDRLQGDFDEKPIVKRRIAFGAESLPVTVTYRAVPEVPAGEPAHRPWRIQLIGEEGQIIGLDVYGDVVLGRGEGGVGHVDLSDLGAKDKGVSRRHAMLRPTPTQIMLLDLGSTNGTSLNSVPVGEGIARPVADGNTIMLGALTLVLRQVESPSTPSRQEEQP